MSLPKVSVIRDRIEAVKEKDIRAALKFQYLTCGRAKEVVSRVCPNDISGHNKATGPKGIDTRIEEFNGEEIIIFNVYTQKREGKKRVIALPVKFEEWAKEVHNYFIQFSEKDPVFYFTRQKLWAKSKPYFKGLSYPIERYSVYDNGQVLKVVHSHPKNFTIHALRHLRATELVEYYNFTGFELAIYGGWKIGTSVGFSGQFDRYINLNWRSYVGKLFKERRW